MMVTKGAHVFNFFQIYSNQNDNISTTITARDLVPNIDLSVNILVEEGDNVLHFVMVSGSGSEAVL